MINKRPYIEIGTKEEAAWQGWEQIGTEIRRMIDSLDKKRVVIAMESYNGTYGAINLREFKRVISPNVTCQVSDIFKDESEIRLMVKKDISSTSSSAKFSTNTIEDYFDESKLEGLRSNIDFIEEGVILIHGTGSYKVWDPDILIYSDVSKWEVLQRFRRGDIHNIGVINAEESFSLHHKWSYFVDWRICDKIKRKVIQSCNYILDTNNWKQPRMANGDVMRSGYSQMGSQPFFTAPFFDPELWENEITDNHEDDFSWVFDCNFEQNNVLFKINNVLFETPAINAIFFNPEGVLGSPVYRKYGLEFPIRFSFIDSLEDLDQNIYTYPGVDYLRDNYAVYHKQCDNYYVMDAERNAKMNVGLCDDISKEYFQEKVQQASTKKLKKDLQKMLNPIRLKKHDHIYVPVETIHTNGSHLMALNISTTPAIFRKSLFDEKDNMISNEALSQFLEITSNLNLNYAKFLNRIIPTAEKQFDEEILSPEENIDFTLKRIFTDQDITLDVNGSIQIFNLIEGEDVSIGGEFQTLLVHYAETFIIPADINKIKIRPQPGNKVGFLIAAMS